MTALPSIAAIINGANLDPTNISQVETFFEQYANLSPTEKDKGTRILRRESLPPFSSGENVVVDGSRAYEAQRQVPWSTIC
ncbi:hypothetical protein BDV36DRAFT_255103 [Aspergillus pseudocaelatus]|uniref:Uncharacterized protein n=1 Tax=Aspergillus pseudocaelatus TaxID=1825620 RepID=A0ABQ6WLG5_9EURO|nr:hypothetical protein BDV36DRAFT_255103 [Aspergillus pseudocaelatus]